MDSDLSAPKYAIGDFVRCWYDLHDYYYGWADLYEEPTPAAMHGIIVDIEFAPWGDVDDPEVIYVIYCIDGAHRFFIETEIYKLS